VFAVYTPNVTDLLRKEYSEILAEIGVGHEKN